MDVEVLGEVIEGEDGTPVIVDAGLDFLTLLQKIFLLLFCGHN